MDVPDEPVGALDKGVGSELSVTFGFPAAAFLYQATSPRMRIDGSEVAVPGWGTHRFSVASGRHQLQVWVPYAIPRRIGKAKWEVQVGPGERVEVEYVAPSVAFASGSLGLPGQQASTGYSTIMKLNLVAAIFAVVAPIVLVLV